MHLERTGVCSGKDVLSLQPIQVWADSRSIWHIRKNSGELYTLKWGYLCIQWNSSIPTPWNEDTSIQWNSSIPIPWNANTSVYIGTSLFRHFCIPLSTTSWKDFSIYSGTHLFQHPEMRMCIEKIQFTCMYFSPLLQTAVDTLLMRFTTSIHDSAYTVVADYAKVCPVVLRASKGGYYPFVPVFFLFYIFDHNSLILCPKKLIFYSKCCSFKELSDGILSSYFPTT